MESLKSPLPSLRLSTTSPDMPAPGARMPAVSASPSPSCVEKAPWLALTVISPSLISVAVASVSELTVSERPLLIAISALALSRLSEPTVGNVWIVTV